MNEGQKLYAEYQRKERLKITRRNMFCDLMGHFKSVDGEEIYILCWQNSPNPRVIGMDNAMARYTLPNSDEPEKVRLLEYDEMLKMIGRDWKD